MSSMEHQHDTTSLSNSEKSSTDEPLQTDTTKKRKRPAKISCELCKARKVKCDRTEPACGWCSKNNRICIYKERKRPDLKASYGVHLEDKLKQIESNLYLLGQKLDNHIESTAYNTEIARGNPAHDSRPDLSRVNQWSWQRPKSPIIYSGSSTSQEAQNAAFTTNGTGTLRVQSLLEATEPQLSTSKASPPPLAGIKESSSAGLPPHDMLYELVDMYFKHVNTWSPILDRKATHDTLFGPQALVGESEIVLLHAIVAVTLRFFENPGLTADEKLRFYEASCNKVQLYALQKPSVTSMKALALITVDALGISNNAHGWNLLSLLARNIVQLGLGAEKSVYVAPADAKAEDLNCLLLPQPNDWIEDEGRRRLFWLTYILDRCATIATSFDFILDERETNRSLPCRYDLFSKNQPVETRWFRSPGSTETSVDCPENLGSFSYHCEVLRILSQIHNFLRTPVNIDSATDVHQWRERYRALDIMLSTWISHLPGEYGKISQLCHSDPGSRVSNWIMIHASFVTSVIRLHSVAAYPSFQSRIFMASENAAQRCLAAVDSLRAIAQDVIGTSMLNLLGPPFALSLWVSSRLLLIHAATTETPIDSRIWFLISTLEMMGQYWNVARDWATTLTNLVHEGQQAEDDARAGRPSSTSKTFTEMRRCAHDLVILISRQPRTVVNKPATKFTSAREIQYYKVFEWFSYPKLPTDSINEPANMTSQADPGGAYPNRPFATPNPESDWFSFKRPYEFKPPYE